jgi:hypothetical protein
METSLHRTLKDRYGQVPGGRSEVGVQGFRVDAVDATGLLIEVQAGPLGSLRTKLRRLLPHNRVTVVKPVVLLRRVVRRLRRDGPDLSARLSPKRGDVVDVFEDLVGVASVFPDPNLAIEVLGVAIDEIRIPRRRRPGFTVIDRRLGEVRDGRTLRVPADLWGLLPEADWNQPFTTTEIAERIGRPLWLAQRVAYCLRLAGAVRSVGTRNRHRLYVRQPGSGPDQA